MESHDWKVEKNSGHGSKWRQNNVAMALPIGIVNYGVKELQFW